MSPWVAARRDIAASSGTLAKAIADHTIGDPIRADHMAVHIRYQCATCLECSFTPEDALKHSAFAGHNRILPFTVR